MKVLYYASPRGFDKRKQDLQAIYWALEDLGLKNLSDFIVSDKANDFFEKNVDMNVFVNTFNKKLKQADVCVFETSVHSLGVGHLIYQAFNHNKPVIILFKKDDIDKKDKKPLFLLEMEEDRLQVLDYTRDKLKQILSEAIEYAKEKSDTRFNFFISPRQLNYLDWIAKNKRIPRSVFLRRLIEEDMKKNQAFLEAA